MEWQVIDMKKKQVGKADLPDAVFAVNDKEHLFYEVVRQQLAGRRAGTHSTKTRSEVRGGGAKPFRQKGTGRARRGTERSPVLVGGGKIFGPKPRDYSFKVNRKTVRAAVCAALSRLAREKKLFIVDQFKLDKPSTKQVAGFCAGLKLDRGLVVDLDNEVLEKSVRNLPRFKFLSASAINVYDLLKYDACLISQKAMEQVTKRFAR